MARIRTATVENVKRLLDKTLFTRHAFEISANTDSILLLITYLDNPDFKFSISELSFDTQWEVKESPGMNFYEAMEVRLDSFEEAIDRIGNWADRILEEISVTAMGVESLAKYLRDRVEKYASSIENPDRPFTSEQAVQWQSKLDSMMRQFEEIQKSNSGLWMEISQLREEVNLLKGKLSSVPKRAWLRALAGKITVIFGETLAKNASEAAIENLKNAIEHLTD